MPEHYSEEQDGPRLRRQRDVIKAQMLVASARGEWLTLSEIQRRTAAECGNGEGYPEPSISAQLRHLRKAENGGYVVEKRLRGDREDGLWEYRVSEKSLKVRVSVAKCVINVLGTDMVCPLCKTLVKSGTRHECSKEAA